MRFNIQHKEELESTNTHLFDLISSSNQEEGLVILADKQINGRGHGGSSWESEKGKNICFSLLIKPSFLLAEDQFVITEVISLAIIKALEKYLDTDNLHIKWPNDIYYNNGKLAGILIQNIISGNAISQSVIGIGLNVNQEVFLSDAPNPISIMQIRGKSLDRETILNEVLSEIDKNYIRLMTFPQSTWLKSSYLKFLYRINKESEFIAHSNKFKAIITGINNYGQLEVKLPSGELQYFSHKEIEFVI